MPTARTAEFLLSRIGALVIQSNFAEDQIADYHFQVPTKGLSLQWFDFQNNSVKWVLFKKITKLTLWQWSETEPTISLMYACTVIE